MKHFWIGLGVILGLVAVSLWGWWTLERIHQPVHDALDAAAEAVLAEDWDRASALAHQARAGWEKHQKTAAALTGHETIEEMDRQFDLLDLFRQLRDKDAFAETALTLANLAETAAQSQRLTWWNLL